MLEHTSGMISKPVKGRFPADCLSKSFRFRLCKSRQEATVPRYDLTSHAKKTYVCRAVILKPNRRILMYLLSRYQRLFNLSGQGLCIQQMSIFLITQR
jgi:hypothetical protein